MKTHRRPSAMRWGIFKTFSLERSPGKLNWLNLDVFKLKHFSKLLNGSDWNARGAWDDFNHLFANAPLRRRTLNGCICIVPWMISFFSNEGHSHGFVLLNSPRILFNNSERERPRINSLGHRIHTHTHTHICIHRSFVNPQIAFLSFYEQHKVFLPRSRRRSWWNVLSLWRQAICRLDYEVGCGNLYFYPISPFRLPSLHNRPLGNNSQIDDSSVCQRFGRQRLCWEGTDVLTCVKISSSKNRWKMFVRPIQPYIALC